MAWTAYRTWVTGETVTAALLNQQIRDNGALEHPDGVTVNSWAPTLEAVTTNPTTDVNAGREWSWGASHYVWARFRIDSATGTPGVGIYFVTLPSTASGVTGSAAVGSGQTVGAWSARNNGSTNAAGGTVTLRSTTEVQFQLVDTVARGVITDAVPWTWDLSDILSFYACYPITS